MSDKKNYEIFQGKTLSDIFKDIYDNSSKTSSQIDGLIKDSTKFLKNLSDAAVLIPLIKEYLDVKIKNNEHIVKLADIVQRLVKNNNQKDENNSGLTEDEREQLYTEVKSWKDEAKIQNDNQINSIQNQVSSSRE